jgi:TIR domain/Yip1 domain
MAVIFISYRREQTAGEARALFNALVSRLGKASVFMDVDGIALGRDFRQVLHERLASCDLVLALVGRDWLDARTATGERRLDDLGDFVRIELETALAHKNTTVTPVLVQGAPMPTASQLPQTLSDFAYRNGFELSHNRWESDVQELIKRLGIGTAPDAHEPVLGSALKNLPSYFPDMARLVTRPKTSILQWTRDPNGILSRALVFVALSVAIGFLFQLPQLTKEQAFSSIAAGMAMFKVLAIVSMAGFIHLSFLAVRGRATFVSTLSAYLYVCSPLYLALVVLETASIGVLRTYDPAVADAARLGGPASLYSSAEQVRLFSANAPGLSNTYAILVLAMLLITPAWFVACWGALRELHGVPRWRSIVVGVATLGAALAMMYGLNYVLVGMFGTNLPPLR